MAFYSPIFSIDVEHTYFSSGRWTSLDFIPVPTCSNRIDNLGFLIRPHPSGIRVFFDLNRHRALGLVDEDQETPLKFVFSVFCRENLFHTVTELSMNDDKAVLFFDNQGCRSDATGRFRLHDAPYVTDRDREPLNSPRMAPIISRVIRFLKPVCIVSIALSRTIIQKLAAASPIACQEYYLKFGAKQTFWKYYLSGRLKETSTYIHDLNNETEFEDTGQVAMPNHQSAQTFRSLQKLFLGQKSGYRFQLKERTSNGRRVLIKRLPVASAGQFIRETVKGQEAIVSEIFING